MRQKSTLIKKFLGNRNDHFSNRTVYEIFHFYIKSNNQYINQVIDMCYPYNFYVLKNDDINITNTVLINFLI